MGVKYYYGISQEDVLTEFRALDISLNDSLLCIASGGDLPLNILALQDLDILAVDKSPDQIKLCRIKQIAATLLDPIKAASFIGYMNIPHQERRRIFRQNIRKSLSEEDCLFWEKYSYAIQKGVINAGKFEQYLRIVSDIVCSIIGKKDLYRLFDCDSVEDQKAVFDERIKSTLIKGIFKIAFHSIVYKYVGINRVAQSKEVSRNIPDFFFQQFRNFCCNTLTRKNYFFQYIFFRKVLFEEALPEYLQPENHETFLKNVSRVEFSNASLEDALSGSERGQFNKIHLSNISDWMSEEKMNDLFKNIRDKTCPGARAIMRFIHLYHSIPETLQELKADYAFGETLAITDRFPFYSIVPILRHS